MPTIAHLKTRGLGGLFMTCSNAACLHSAPFTFAALRLGDDAEFPSIMQRRRFVCARRGGRVVHAMPDPHTQRTAGTGR